MVRTLTAIVVLAGVAGGAPRLKDPPAPAFPDGRWAVEGYECNGQVRDARGMAGYVIVHTRTATTLEHFGREVGTERVTWGEARAGAGQMDFTPDGGGVKKGIWKLDGDTLTECESAPGGDRPTDYTAPKGSGRTVWVLRRIKE